MYSIVLMAALATGGSAPDQALQDGATAFPARPPGRFGGNAYVAWQRLRAPQDAFAPRAVVEEGQVRLDVPEQRRRGVPLVPVIL